MNEVGTDDTLILGIGNVLWADEGFGVRALETLSRDYEFPAGVTLMDGGTQGLYLLPYVKQAKRLIVFDAVDYALAPGTLKLVRNAEIPAYLGVRKMSLHQSCFQEVLSLAMLSGSYPQDILLIGVQPEDISDYGGSLRPAIKARLPEALHIALDTLSGWGIEATPRDAEQGVDPPAIGLDAYEAGRPSEEAAYRRGDPRVLQQVLGEEPR